MSLPTKVAPEGAGRFDHVHGDEGTVDIEPFLAGALDDVVETLMLFGQFPQPKRNRQQRVVFDLRERITEHIDPAEMTDLYLSMLTDYSSDHDLLRMKEAARVEKMLREELEGSELVRARAEELAEQDKE